MMVEPIKFTTRRKRPDGSNDLSFPSGHAAITFAGATVLERHLGWKKAALAYLGFSRDRLYKLMGEYTGKPPETIHRDFDRNKWLFAEEAVAYGCADKVLDRAPEPAAKPRSAGAAGEENDERL